MDEANVVRILRALSDGGVGVCVDGGWSVDGLLQRQTRQHANLDLTLDAAHGTCATEILEGLGFRTKPGGSEPNIVLQDRLGVALPASLSRRIRPRPSGEAPTGLELFAHPISFFSQKVFIALYENEVEFSLHMVVPGDRKDAAAFESHWPFRRIPVLLDADRVIAESSVIIEYLDLNRPGDTLLIPADRSDALEVRMLDRAVDGYLLAPLQKIIGDRFLPPEQQDPHAVEASIELLDIALEWLDRLLEDRTWIAPSGFGLADCSAAPALACLSRLLPAGLPLRNLSAYRERLLDRSACRKTFAEAEPYQQYLPLQPLVASKHCQPQPA